MRSSCRSPSPPNLGPAPPSSRSYAIGLAVRAERISDELDRASMRQSGIHHAGFYGKLSLAKVDGFGSDTKLSVGDRIWFAGVDFEF